MTRDVQRQLLETFICVLNSERNNLDLVWDTQSLRSRCQFLWSKSTQFRLVSWFIEWLFLSWIDYISSTEGWMWMAEWERSIKKWSWFILTHFQHSPEEIALNRLRRWIMMGWTCSLDETKHIRGCGGETSWKVAISDSETQLGGLCYVVTLAVVTWVVVYWFKIEANAAFLAMFTRYSDWLRAGRLGF